MTLLRRSLKDVAVPIADQPKNSEWQLPEDTLIAQLPPLLELKDIYTVDHTNNVVGIVKKQVLANVLLEELKRTNAFLQTMMEAMDDAVTMVDEEQRIIQINAKSEQLYALASHAIAGKPLRHYFDEEALVLWSVMKDKQPVVHQYNQPKPGLHVIVNTVPVFEGEACVGGISIERDITDVVRLNEELSSKTASLHHLNTTSEDEPFQKIIGRSEPVRRAIHLAAKVAKTTANVLITGESGVGKELFAEGIHQASDRAEKPFIAINCGAIPAALFESELFGYVQGAFTGAAKGGKKGKLDAAKGGTLFLDEVGEMPAELQVKLLRVLEERAYYRVGGHEAIPLDVRIVAATNRDLEKMVAEGRFREDFYYRLHVISISIPPLRERMEDLPELVQSFLQEFAQRYEKPVPKLDPEVLYALRTQKWEGNIRQLRNLIERIVILNGDHEGSVHWYHLPESYQQKLKHMPLASKDKPKKDERMEIINALEKTYGNKSAAAKLLGISRATLYNKLKHYKL
ncbi:sigma 54-interacting transcriptional regulator [Shouchella clausii]|uniref:sigma-54 interaction domain-containing protein n=1 Tax=Shouchella clausii TaxID=79880 RepID=UPI002ACDC214|nr:sigma 54-interacting transcriptional regulator [Shouchella clausii]WQG96142.1 sigma 54-interacting transcriptional regulator [Shouchella clausii]